MIQLDFQSRRKKSDPDSTENLPLLATPQPCVASEQNSEIKCRWSRFRANNIELTYKQKSWFLDLISLWSSCVFRLLLLISVDFVASSNHGCGVGTQISGSGFRHLMFCRSGSNIQTFLALADDMVRWWKLKTIVLFVQLAN